MALTIERDLIILTVAVYLGGVFTGFFRALTNDLIVPFISIFLPYNDVGKLPVVFGGRTFDIGTILIETINAAIAIVLVMFIVSVLRAYGMPLLSPITGGKR